MLDKNRFVEVVSDNEEIILPGDIKVRKVIPSKEELELLDKDMDRYSIRVRNTYKTSNRETHHKYDEDLSTLSDHLEPLYILKDKKFFGLCLSLTFNAEKRLGVFLVSGGTHGATTDGHKNKEEEDINVYDLGFK